MFIVDVCVFIQYVCFHRVALCLKESEEERKKS